MQKKSLQPKKPMVKYAKVYHIISFYINKQQNLIYKIVFNYTKAITKDKFKSEKNHI